MLTPSDLSLFKAQGFGAELSIEFPIALLAVDFVHGFMDTASFGGFNTNAASTNTIDVLNYFRDAGFLIAHSRIVFSSDGSDSNVFSRKVPSILRLTEDNLESHIVEHLKPHPGEIVLSKTVPSAFFGTPLLSLLTQNQIKTLVIAGVTTSGCVRASVVDAMSYGFCPIVLSDCVGDRVESAHKASLRDMEMKYAEVMSSGEFFHLLYKKRRQS